MRVLVTRPEPDATRTAAALEARGHTALVDPVVAIETLQDVVIPQRAYARILVTSGNAVRAIEGRPDAARLHGVPLLAVGDRTAALAREAGFGQIESAGGGADTLVVHAAATGTPEAGPILYLAGTDRAGDVDGRLRAAGFEVDLVEVYRAAPVGRLGAAAATALAAGEIDTVLFASRRTAEAFAAAVRAKGLEPALGRVIAAAISAKVAGGPSLVRRLPRPATIRTPTQGERATTNAYDATVSMPASQSTTHPAILVTPSAPITMP